MGAAQLAGVVSIVSRAATEARDASRVGIERQRIGRDCHNGTPHGHGLRAIANEIETVAGHGGKRKKANKTASLAQANPEHHPLPQW